MDIHILTLFPGMFQGPLTESVIGRALEAGIARVHLHDIRDHAPGRHRVTDDYAYGDTPGMVMKPEPVFAAAEAALSQYDEEARARIPVVYLTPQGHAFMQRDAERFSKLPAIVLLCGHYEGVDQRVRDHLVTEELSIGDFVLTGGELAAMAVVDAVVRLLPGALNTAGSAQDDSFTTGLLQGPLYTRPPEFRGWRIPEALLSGDHECVARWNREEALRATLERRPDLLLGAPLTDADRRFLRSLGWRG